MHERITDAHFSCFVFLVLLVIRFFTTQKQETHEGHNRNYLQRIYLLLFLPKFLSLGLTKNMLFLWKLFILQQVPCVNELLIQYSTIRHFHCIENQYWIQLSGIKKKKVVLSSYLYLTNDLKVTTFILYS